MNKKRNVSILLSSIFLISLPVHATYDNNTVLEVIKIAENHVDGHAYSLDMDSDKNVYIINVALNEYPGLTEECAVKNGSATQVQIRKDNLTVSGYLTIFDSHGFYYFSKSISGGINYSLSDVIKDNMFKHDFIKADFNFESYGVFTLSYKSDQETKTIRVSSDIDYE